MEASAFWSELGRGRAAYLEQLCLPERSGHGGLESDSCPAKSAPGGRGRALVASALRCMRAGLPVGDLKVLSKMRIARVPAGARGCAPIPQARPPHSACHSESRLQVSFSIIPGSGRASESLATLAGRPGQRRTGRAPLRPMDLRPSPGDWQAPSRRSLGPGLASGL